MAASSKEKDSPKLAPRVSVLVPTYNYARYLPEALDSVLEQDFADFEVLIADDCSSDDSAKVIAEYAAKDRRIRSLIHPARLGMVENWNWCLKQARAPYVKFLFGDDKLAGPHALKKMVEMLDGHPGAVLAVSPRYIMDEASRVVEVWDHFGRPGCHRGKEVIVQCLEAGQNLVGEPSAVLLRRSRAGRGFNCDYRQYVDLEMWFHLLQKGDLVYAAEPLCHFRRHPLQETEANQTNGVSRREAHRLFAEYRRDPRFQSPALRERRLKELYDIRKQLRSNPGRSMDLRKTESELAAEVDRRAYQAFWLRRKISRPFVHAGRWFKTRLSAPGPTSKPSPDIMAPAPAIPIPDFIRPGDLVFDVGANIGQKAEAFLARGARVLCIEPQPDCVRILREKHPSNPNWIVLGVGLAGAPGRLELSICSQAPTISTFSEGWKHGRFEGYKWEKKALVEVTTLDALIEAHGLPRYCKIDVEGFEKQVLKGLGRPIPFLSFEFAIEFVAETKECLEYLAKLGYRAFNFTIGEAPELKLPEWSGAEQVLAAITALPQQDLWGDIYARFDPVQTPVPDEERPAPRPVELNPKNDILAQLQKSGLWQPSKPLRLHLGCGENRFAGYLNLDFPSSAHNVMRVQPDACINILQLEFPEASVDEIRLHHVFEHFNRVTALAQIIKWQRWLKPGGLLWIETPDLMGSARTLVSTAPLKIKMAVARHLAGDQAAAWAYHLEHWFPERFEHTLKQLGFEGVCVETVSWPHEPFLSNVTAKAVKRAAVPLERQLQNADDLLWQSAVAEAEKATHRVWTQQLRAVLDGAAPETPINSALPAVVPAKLSGAEGSEASTGPETVS